MAERPGHISVRRERYSSLQLVFGRIGCLPRGAAQRRTGMAVLLREARLALGRPCRAMARRWALNSAGHMRCISLKAQAALEAAVNSELQECHEPLLGDVPISATRWVSVSTPQRTTGGAQAGLPTTVPTPTSQKPRLTPSAVKATFSPPPLWPAADEVRRHQARLARPRPAPHNCAAPCTAGNACSRRVCSRHAQGRRGGAAGPHRGARGTSPPAPGQGAVCATPHPHPPSRGCDQVRPSDTAAAAAALPTQALQRACTAARAALGRALWL